MLIASSGVVIGLQLEDCPCLDLRVLIVREVVMGALGMLCGVGDVEGLSLAREWSRRISEFS